MMMRRWAGALVSVWLVVLAAAAQGQVTTTQVTDTVYEASGALGQGSVIISWPTFSTMSGQAVAAGTTTVQVGATGAFSVALAPNAGANPMGTYYTVVYHLSDGTVSREYWIVPVSSAQVTISSIRSTVLPLSVAMQTVSKQYVDNAVNSLSVQYASGSAYVLRSGDTMTGPLVLPGDPASANQAADKHYVDVNVAGLTAGLAQKVSTLPTAGQTVSQPTGTTLGVNNLNSEMYVSQYQTGSGNNGISNIVTGTNCTGGCTAKAEPNYPSTEVASGTSMNGGVSFGWNYHTHLKDLRGGAEVDLFQDPHPSVSAPDVNAGHTIVASATQSAANVFQTYGSANPQYQGLNILQNALSGGNNISSAHGRYGKSTYSAISDSGFYFTQGQHIQNNTTQHCYGVGDCLIAGYAQFSSGGWRDGSDEGAHPGGMKIYEDPAVPTGICSAGCTTGSTQVSVGSLSYPLGEGRFLMDKNTTHVVSSTSSGCTLVSGVQQQYPFAQANFSGTNCFPVSTFFLTTGAVSSASNNEAPGTVTVAIATSSVPSGYATSTAAAPAASGVACVADTTSGGAAQSNFETAAYTTVDATHFSLTLNKPHDSSPTIAMGGMCGYGLEATVDTRSGIKLVVPVMGAFSATGLYYAANNVVQVGQNGESGFVNTSASVSSISRNNNVTTVALTGGQFASLSGVNATIAGVADASFNGTFQITTTGTNTFTYANTGANGTSTGGTASYLTGGFNLYPMAEVLNVLNASTHAVDGGNIMLAANMVPWAANDPLEEPHFHINLIQGDGQYSAVSQTMPRPNYGEALGIGSVFGGVNGPTFVGQFLYNTTPVATYFGNGGTLTAPFAAIQIQGVWNRVMDISAGESTVFNVHCNSHGCGQWNSGYNLFALQYNAGGSTDTVTYTPTTNTLGINVQGASYSFGPGGMQAPNASVGRLSTTSSVNCDGGGHKCALLPLCTTSSLQGKTCDTTLTWTTPFADAGYVLTCSVDGTGSTGTGVLSFYNKTAAGAVLRLINVAALANTGVANCIAEHP